MNAKEIRSFTVGEYLLYRLHCLGVEHIFGIPGDYVLRFNQLIEQHPDIEFINTTRESSAGYAANAYAQFKGIGAACITYGVGIEIISAMTQAYVESLPLVVISGTISPDEFKKHKECHHLINRIVKEHGDCTQLEIFKHVTIDQGVLQSPSTAADIIDRVLHACMQYKMPVYLEIPRNMVDQPLLSSPITSFFSAPLSHSYVLQQALADTQTIFSSCHHPLIWAGHEIARFGLSAPLLSFAEKHQIPIVSSLLGKTVIDEHHPLFIGVYQGKMSSEQTLETIEKCDCLLTAGVVLSDIDTGIFSIKLDQNHRIIASRDVTTIANHQYPIQLADYIKGLNTLSLSTPFSLPFTARHNTLPDSFIPEKGTRITIKRLFQCIQSHLNENSIVISDAGDSLFASTDLALSQNAFFSNSYFASIGAGTPMAMGAQFADPKRRVIAIVGDGGFQMSATELSTALRYNLHPIVILLNNHGYGTERVLLEGSFNDLVDWNYTQLPSLLGGGVGIKVKTEEVLQEALDTAWANKESFYLIEVDIDKNDFSPSLQRLGKF